MAKEQSLQGVGSGKSSTQKNFQQKNLKIVKFNQINDLPKVWVICYSPLNAFHCSNKFSSMKKMKSVEVKSFYLAELFLLVKK